MPVRGVSRSGSGGFTGAPNTCFSSTRRRELLAVLLRAPPQSCWSRAPQLGTGPGSCRGPGTLRPPSPRPHHLQGGPALLGARKEITSCAFRSWRTEGTRSPEDEYLSWDKMQNQHFYEIAVSCSMKDKENANRLWVRGWYRRFQVCRLGWFPREQPAVADKQASKVTDQKHLSVDKRTKYSSDSLLRDFAGRLRAQG